MQRSEWKRWTRRLGVAGLSLAGAGLCAMGGCPTGGDDVDLSFSNTTDPTNAGATYVGSAACVACHPSLPALTAKHGHMHALNRVQGVAPSYNAAADRGVVTDPPAGYSWNDIAYVISGYTLRALFVDQDGFVITTGFDGVDAQYNLNFGANGTAAGFVPYLPAQAERLEYAFECIRCHTTGPVERTADNPQSQGGREGIQGTWAEANVTCEACHGPGSNHVPNPQLRNIFVDSSADTCARCHAPNPDDQEQIPVVDGYLSANAQYSELRASGGHSDFGCGYCHDPHASTVYDRDNGIRNDCTDCHGGQNLAFHADTTFEWGDYVEPIGCESCHMPLAGRSGSNADPAVVGDDARIGDVRTHIFRIDVSGDDYTSMITADDGEVIVDDEGRAAVTVDFACLRCHHGAGNAFPLTLDGAGLIADGMHDRSP